MGRKRLRRPPEAGRLWILPESEHGFGALAGLRSAIMEAAAAFWPCGYTASVFPAGRESYHWPRASKIGIRD